MSRLIMSLAFSVFLLVSTMPSVGLAQSEKQGIALYNEANELRTKGKSRQDLEKALEKYQQALRIFEITKSEKSRGDVFNTMGLLYDDVGQYQNALDSHNKSLAIRQKLGDVKGEGESLNNIGLVYSRIGQYQKALEYYEKSLPLRRKVGNLRGEDSTLHNIGQIYGHYGNYRKALEFYEKALSNQRKVGNLWGEGFTLDNIGSVYSSWGQYQKALEHYEKSLAIRRKQRHVGGEGHCMASIGSVYRSWGQYQKALEHYEKALEIYKTIGYVRDEGRTLDSIGYIYSSLGQYEKALEYYEKSLTIKSKVRDVGEEAVTLTHMGGVYNSLGQYEKALGEYEKALEIKKTIGVPHKGTEDSIGELYLDMGNVSEAEPILKRTRFSSSLGRLALMKSDFVDARTSYENLLKSGEKSGYVDWLFAAYTGLGKSYEGLGEYAKAEEFYDKGMKLTEEIRSGLLPSERKNFFEVKVLGFPRSEPSKGLTRVRLKLNKSAGSIESSEATRARAFADHIALQSAAGTGGIPRDIPEKEDALVSKVAALKKELAKTDKEKSPGRYENLSKEIKEAESDLQAFVEMLWQKHKPYAAVKYPRPVTVKEAAIRPDEHVIMFDVVGEGVGVKLVKGKEIVQTFFLKMKPDELDKDVKAFREPFERADLRALNVELGKKLHKKLLSSVLMDVPEGTPVVIIPDGILAVLPFEALVVSGTPAWKTGRRGDYPEGLTYLGDLYPISYYQSITALTLARTLGEKKKAGDRLLVMADPVFDMKDQRAQATGKTQVASNEKKYHENLMVAMEDSSGLVFKRLPETAAMASNLNSLFKDRSDLYTGMDATKEQFLKSVAPGMERYRWVVFATHGVFSTKVPGLLEPFLALTLVPPGTDGLLTLSDVMSLKLNADVVALTACQTGLGKELSGEGVMSLGRAFQYAGAKSVLMTLWSVAEKSSVMTVESFFKELRDGKSKLAALKLAREEIRKQGYDHPFFWAPFILVGEAD